ncbi:Deoxynucleoside kinase [Popillia japonica]|uniref:Deoxynucleoside kinase n=1 Tax=Popillia japonica TaxID=7064 RepID=A0AAW1KXJ9_POPJA
MEDCITAISRNKRPAESPVRSSPIKRSTFVGITPLKEYPFINTPVDRPFRVSIEGNIGAGKSTLLKHFANFPGIETYPEPVDLWRNLKGHNLLQLLYSDMKRWQNTFQSYVQLSRLKVQTSPPKSKATRVQMFERSIQNNRYCFLEVAHQNGMHNAEYAVLDKWYRCMRENADISLDLIGPTGSPGVPNTCEPVAERRKIDREMPGMLTEMVDAMIGILRQFEYFKADKEGNTFNIHEIFV